MFLAELDPSFTSTQVLTKKTLLAISRPYFDSGKTTGDPLSATTSDAKCHPLRISTPLISRFLVMLSMLLPANTALAETPRISVNQSLRHMEERLHGLVEAGNLRQEMPVLVASISTVSPENEEWFVPYAMKSLVAIFGPNNMRVCHDCIKTEVTETTGRLTLRRNDWNIQKLVQMDQQLRQESPAAKSAIYINENQNIVSVRVVSLADSHVIFAANFDPDFKLLERSENIRRHWVELEKRKAGAGHTHVLWDGIMYPNQHLALDILDQFGARGEHLAGISTSMFTPILGLGFAYHYVFQDAWNVSLGTKVLFAAPNLLLRVLFEEDLELIDPLINTVFVLRVPIPETNIAVSGMIASGFDSFPFPTQSPTLGVGLTLLNPTFMPVFP